MFNAGVRGKRAKDGVGFLSTAEQFNQKSFLVPTVTSFSVTDVSYVPLDNTAVDTAGGETIVINGSGFAPGATVQVGATTIGSVTYIDQNRLAFSAPALSSGSYTIYVTNSNGGTGILVSGLVYSGLPTYTTSAGSLGTIYETANINTAVVATGDAPITYTLLSGTLPSGATLNSNGTITGNAPIDGSSTTYSFTIQASDAQLQDSTRAFTLTINTDVLSWSLANNTVYSLDGGTAMSNVTLSATSAANSNSSVTFAANTLPTGVSLSGNTIYGTPTAEQTVYSALTATASQTGRTATRYVSWVVSLTDVYFKYNTLAIQGPDTTFVKDASTNNFAVTLNGDTKPNSFNPYTPGYYSVYFNSQFPYIRTNSNAAFNFGTGDFTVEFWYYSASIGADARFISNESYTGSGIDISYESGSSRISWYIGGTSYNTATLPTSNKWHHIAYTRTGTTLYVYVDGIKVNTYSSFTANITSANSLTIGGNSTGGATLDGGYISNLRLVKGVSVYSTGTNFTPSTTPLTAISGTSLLTCQSNRFIDNSTNNFTITVAGTTSISSFQPFTPNSSYSSYGSGYFDGSGDWISVPNNAALAFGTGDFTVECWGFITGSSGTVMNYTNGQSTNANFSWEMYQYSASEMWFSVFDGSTQYTAKSTTFKINQWNHLAAVRSGNTLTLYVNGVAGATTVSIAGVSVANLASATLKVGSYNNGSSYITGYITDVRVVKGTAVYTTAFTPPTAPLTAITNTSLLTLQNNQPINNHTFLDNSSNNLLITKPGASNSSQGTFSPYGANWSNYFDGTGDYLTAATNSNLSFGTGNFTVEFWFNVQGAGDHAQQHVFQTRDGTNNGLLFQYDRTNKNFSVASDSGLTGLTTANNAISDGIWYHVALTRSGTTIYFFVNGVQIATTTSAQNFNSTTPYLSRRYATDGFLHYFNGYISNLRMVTGTAVYTAAFTPPTTPLTAIANTSLLTCQSNRLIDNSINNLTITKNGDVSVQRYNPFNPSSLTPTSYSGYFNGSTDYLTPSSSVATNITTGAFTVEFWINQSSISTKYVFGGGAASTGRLTCRVGSAAIAVIDTNGTNSFTVPTFLTNTWYHIVIVRDASSNTTVFVNGTRSSTGTISITTSYTDLQRIGAYLTNYFSGYISNFRVVVGTAVYDPTQTTITVPTTPLIAISGTSLLTCQSSTFIDNSTNNYTISATGNTQPTIQNPFGYTSTTTNGYTVSTIGGSAYFDGSGDYITAPSNAAFAFGTGDFTIEGWFYFTGTISTYQRPWWFGDDNDNLEINTSVIRYGGASLTVITGSTALANTWYHIAYSRQSGSGKLFINGVQVGSTTASSYSSSARTLTLMATSSGANPSTGYVSDFRVIKGQALYTSNFVPPAQTLTAVQNSTLLLNMTSAGIYDASTQNILETAGDAKLSTTVSKFGGSSMYFDGTGDYLSIPYNPNSQFGTGNFTIEFWINFSSVASGQQIISAYMNTNLNYAVYTTSSGTLNYYLSSDGTTWNIASGVSFGSISTSTWYHVALVRNGSTFTPYLNGVAGTTATSSAAIFTNTSPTYIGAYYNGTSATSFFTGYIDDLRITKGYARYTANFTAPTTTFKIK